MLEAKKRANKGKGLKILIPKEMLQKLTIVFAQVKTGNPSNDILFVLNKKSTEQYNQFNKVMKQGRSYIYEFEKW